MHWKFQFIQIFPDGTRKKVVEIICTLYETCLEQERIYNRLYNGHAIIRAI